MLLKIKNETSLWKMLNLVKCLIPTKKRKILYSKELKIFYLGQNCLGLDYTYCTLLFMPYLSSRGTDIFHIFNAADTVLWNFPASHSDIVPEATRTFITKPGYLTFRRQIVIQNKTRLEIQNSRIKLWEINVSRVCNCGNGTWGQKALRLVPFYLYLVVLLWAIYLMYLDHSFLNNKIKLNEVKRV